MHTKGRGIAATFCCRKMSHNVQQVELLATWRRDKMCTELMLHDYNTISGHDGTCRCSINQGYIPATFPCVCTHCDFIPGTCLCYNILLLTRVAATCPCKMIPLVFGHDFVPGTYLCYNALLHVPLVCIACNFVADTYRCNISLHQNPTCLGTFNQWDYRKVNLFRQFVPLKAKTDVNDAQ
jgi:hypothetical protein